MKTSQLLAIAGCGSILFGAVSVHAQETAIVEQTTVETIRQVKCNDIYTPGSWKNNWYIQLGAGIQSPFVENGSSSREQTHNITAVYNLGVGRWISPYIGFRFSAYYGSIHWNQEVMASARVANLNVDFMWDMFNSISGYKPDRVFSIVPYVGLGGSFIYNFHPRLGNINNDHGILRTNQWALPVSAGLQLRFRLCNHVDIFAEGRASFYGDNFNNYAGGRPVDINLSAIGGLTIHLTGSKFESYNPCNYLEYVNTLNNQVNDLRGQLAATSAALAVAESQLPCPETPQQEIIQIQAPMLSTVRFNINSAEISDNEMVNIYNMAEYLKANPDINVVVDGYADKDTGTSGYNMKLSERRAQAVVDILVKTYGISPDRVTTKASGSETQPYDINNWNRIVIFSLQ